MVFTTPKERLPIVIPSVDLPRVDALERALAAATPVGAEADLTRRMLETGRAHVENMRGLLDAVSERNTTAYRQLSTQYFAVKHEMQAINRDSKTMCGQLLADARLPPEAIQSTMRQGYGAFRKCYEAGLARNPALTGKVSIRFVIDAEGGVRDAETVTDVQQQPQTPDPGTERFFETLGFRVTPGTLDSTPLQDQEVAECIVRHVRTLRFPRPPNGNVSVVYPIQLTPG